MHCSEVSSQSMDSHLKVCASPAHDVISANPMASANSRSLVAIMNSESVPKWVLKMQNIPICTAEGYICKACIDNARLKLQMMTSGAKDNPPSNQLEKQYCKVPSCNYFCFSDKALRAHMHSGHPKPRKCTICDIKLPSLRELRKHISSAHADTKRFACNLCSYVGTNISSLSNHKTRIHDGAKESPKLVVCRERDGSDGSGEACQASLKRVGDLRTHLADHHGIAAARDEITEEFQTLEEFNLWKASFEEDSSAKYNSRDGKLKAGTTVTFVCSRSGLYTPTVENRQRRIKSQGSCKLGFACTAAIRAVMSVAGRVSVTVFPFHYGHGTDRADLAHLRLPTTTYDYARKRLREGVPLSRIIQVVRQSREEAGDPGASRAYLLKRKDLLNISAKDQAYKDRIQQEEGPVPSPEVSSSSESDSGAPPDPPSAPSSPLPSVVTPRRKRSRPNESSPSVLQKVRDVMQMARGREDSISTSTSQDILSHLAQIEQMLAQEDGGSEATDAGPSTPRVLVYRQTANVLPTATVTVNGQATPETGQSVTPMVVVQETEESEPRGTVADLVAGQVARMKAERDLETKRGLKADDVGRVKRPRRRRKDNSK